MKSTIFHAFATALLCAGFASCSSEEPVAAPKSDCLTISVAIPNMSDIRTRTDSKLKHFSDGATVNELKCYVYNQELGSTSSPVSIEDILLENIGETRGGKLSLAIPCDQSYDLVFLATSCPQDVETSKVSYAPESRILSVNYDGALCNEEEYDCFFGVLTDVTLDSENNSVTLHRPYAQLNIGTKDLADYNKLSAYAMQKANMAVDGIYSSMNVMDGSLVGDASNVTFNTSLMPTDHEFPVSDVDYLAMNYLLVNERRDVQVAASFIRSDGSAIERSFTNVPVQRNYRTNVFGRLLTDAEDKDFTVNIDPEYDKNDIYENYDSSYIEMSIDRSKNPTISITSTLTEYKIVNLNSFADTDGYVKLQLSDLEVEGVVTELSFSDGVRSVTSFNINTSLITDLSNMFNNCETLVNVNLTKFDFSKITNMKNLFFNCTNLQSVDVDVLDLVNIRNSASSIFKNCTSLTSVNAVIKNVRTDFYLKDCPLDNETAMRFINALVEDYSIPAGSRVFTFSQVTYDTLTEDQIKIATDKGWEVKRA